jgi:hypothetical protein
VVVYRHLLLENEDTGESPVLLGPILIHQTKSYNSYHELAISLYQAGVKELKAFGTDGDPNMYNAFSCVFHNSLHLLCELHIKDNITKKMSDCNIDKSNQQKIMNKLFGFQINGDQIDGLVQTKSDDEFDQVFEEFVELLKSIPNTSEFLNYFMKFKIDLFERNLRADNRQKAGLGDPPKPYYQNSNESINRLIKYKIDKEHQIYEFVKHYEALLKQEQEKIEISLTGAGKFKIKNNFAKSFLTPPAYSSATKQSKIKQIQKLNNVSVVELEKESCANEMIPNLSNVPPNVTRSIFEKAFSIFNTPGLVAPAPGKTDVFLTPSHSNPNTYHSIQVFKKSLKCIDCPQFKTFAICAHSIAVALKIDALDTFIEYRNAIQKTPSLEKVATGHLPSTRGTKKHQRTQIRLGQRAKK